MTKSSKANVWNAIIWVTGIIAMLVAALGGYTNLGRDVQENTKEIGSVRKNLEETRSGIESYVWPEIELSKKHRYEDSRDQMYMDQKFEKLEKSINEFSVEQRNLNMQILKSVESLKVAHE